MSGVPACAPRGRTGRGWCAAALVLVVAAAPVGPARADIQGLLVGVSGYPNLPARLRLQGPLNDVQRMRTALLRHGAAPGAIEVLADGVAGAALPTRSNILAALDRLAQRAGPQDVAVLHFAGHGSRQPMPDGRSMQEIFLPLDVGRWDGGTQQVTGALSAAELRAAVDRIAARGAFVWAVFDACHSARLVRGGDGDDVRWRHVDPAVLGAPVQAPAPDGDAKAPRPTGAAGRTAFFYAAQAHEVTPELELADGTGRRRVQGLFSSVVAGSLERGNAMTYRQLGQVVLAEYGAQAAATATPLFSGSALDTFVLGRQSTPKRRWPLRREGGKWLVPAGALEGVAPGTVLAVLPGPSANDASVLGYVIVMATRDGVSEVAPAAHEEHPAMASAALRAGQVLRLATAAVPLQLRLAVDSRGCDGRCLLADAAAWLRRNGIPGVAAAWVGSPEQADLVLEQRPGRVLLLAPTQRSDVPALRDQAPGVSLAGPGAPADAASLASRLAAPLHAIARTRNLLRLAAGYAGSRRDDGFSVGAEVLDAAGRRRPVESPATARSGDRIVLEMVNRGTRALDVTVLYVDADHGVKALFPGPLGESNRIDAGARRVLDDITVQVPPSGLERMVVITVPARRLGESTDYAWLQQPALARQRSRGASREPDLLADAVFAEHLSRGEPPALPPASMRMEVLTFEVQP